ncbi:MAG: PqqD family protein [Vicinamibacterales bacterium]
MIAVLLALVLALQFGQRTPLTPAETLLEPAILQAIDQQPLTAESSPQIAGTDRDAGWILLTCRANECATATRAARKLNALVTAGKIPPSARSIRVASQVDQSIVTAVKAAIHVAESTDRPLQVVRGPWSTAAITDEVVEVLIRRGGHVADVRPFEDLGQLRLDPHGIPTTTMVVNAWTSRDHVAATAAAAAYFLATLPNAGAEALLSHLMVGAHARLAEDGRRAVALMGPGQRASADVLILLGQAIEREQRRIRSVARFMPAPLDATLADRLADMEKGITGVWSSLGVTSSPFVPPAERIRGRGGDDQRVPSRIAGATGTVDTASIKHANHAMVGYEIINFIDGRRTVSDIRDAVMAEFGQVGLPLVVQYLEALAKAGAVTLR